MNNNKQLIISVVYMRIFVIKKLLGHLGIFPYRKAGNKQNGRKKQETFVKQVDRQPLVDGIGAYSYREFMVSEGAVKRRCFNVHFVSPFCCRAQRK